MRNAHTLFVWNGNFAPGGVAKEEWTMTLRGTPVEPVTSLQGMADIAAAGWQAWRDHLAPHLASTSNLLKCTVASVTALGLWEKDATGQFKKGEKILTKDGTNASTQFHPLQTALACTLHTVRAGATGRGRFFFPLVAETLANDGGLTPARHIEIATSVASFVQALNAIPNFGVVEVFSSKGVSTRVDSISVGRIPDTLRTRRRSLVETREVRPIP